MRFGSAAVVNGQREVFEPQAFSYAERGVFLNVQHQRNVPIGRYPGNLELTQTDETLSFRAKLPDTQAGRDTLVNIRTGIYQGSSIEFVATDERFDNGTRYVSKAALLGIGIVDVGAYSDATVEARQLEIVETRQGRTIRGRFPYGERFTVLDGERVRKSQYKQRVFEKSIQSEINEILLYISEGRFSRPIASKRAGSLRFTDSEHELRFQAAAADLSYLDDFAANLEAGTVRYVIRPNISIPPPEVVAKPYRDFPEGPENPGVFVREFLDVRLNSLTISPRPQGAGSVQVRQFSPWL